MDNSPRTFRGMLVFGLAIGLAFGACGSPSSSATPVGSGGSGGGGSSDGSVGGSLAPGLSLNLDALDSYQFIESIPVSSSGAGASSGVGPIMVTGTVINRPLKSIWVKDGLAQFIVIGDEAWRSLDGSTWTAGDPTDTILTDLLPGHDYASWFDAKSAYFKVIGEESKNGVPCVHYKGDSSLAGLYSGAGGSPADFRADVWIAKAGDYPVAGVYGLLTSAGNQAGDFGFSFDITHVNEPVNTVTAPTTVVPIPT